LPATSEARLTDSRPSDGTPPESIFLSGESYFQAAEYLETAIREGRLKLSFQPQSVYYLYRRSLELGMKAFLRSRGATVRELAGHRLGYNLGNLLEEALVHRLPLDSDFRKLARRVIKMFDRADREQQFRYVVVDVRLLPELGAVHRVGQGLFAAIRPYCPGSSAQPMADPKDP
jgi:hypothetical protein